MTQSELAEKLCGKKSLISNYENGYSTPDNSVVASLENTQRYFNQIRLACNQMRELIAVNSGWSGVTYNASTHEITGIQEVGDGGGVCVADYGCSVPYTDIDVPPTINQL